MRTLRKIGNKKRNEQPFPVKRLYSVKEPISLRFILKGFAHIVNSNTAQNMGQDYGGTGLWELDR
jgi:hypothetical protein